MKADVEYQQHYLITFQGVYPIGAYAVVMARSFAEAEELFLEEFVVEFPNTKTPHIHSTELLEFGLKRCHIISNGDY